MAAPKNYQSSDYLKQAEEFKRQHGNIGTPESTSRDRLAGDAMILGTQNARRQLKVIAAVTRETMREVLVRLVAEELKRVAPAVQL